LWYFESAEGKSYSRTPSEGEERSGAAGVEIAREKAARRGVRALPGTAGTVRERDADGGEGVPQAMGEVEHPVARRCLRFFHQALAKRGRRQRGRLDGGKCGVGVSHRGEAAR